MNNNEDRSTEQQVRSKITLITFILSLLVIWIHTYNLETYGIDGSGGGLDKFTWLLETTWSAFIGIAVPFFFFISGFLFFRTFRFTWDGIKSKYISRIKGIVIPYIIWCTLYYLYYVILTNLPNVKNLVNSDTVPLSLLRWLDALWPHEYYTLWFLKELIILIALGPLIYIIFKNKYIGALFLLIFVLNSQFGWVSIPLSGHIYYLAGAYIAVSLKNAEYYRNRILTVLGCVFLIALLALRFRFLDNTIIRLAFFVATWFAVDIFKNDHDYPWWMKITFFTYVAHDALLEMLEKLVLIVLGKRTIFALLDYIFVPLIVFAILAGIAAFLRRFLSKVWRVITGERL